MKIRIPYYIPAALGLAVLTSVSPAAFAAPDEPNPAAAMEQVTDTMPAVKSPSFLSTPAAPVFNPGAAAVAESEAKADSADEGKVVAKDLFIKAPTEIVPTIDRSTRLDMIDYFESGIDRASKNELGGHARITALTDDAITFTTSEAGERTIAVIDREKKRPVVMLITTLKTPQEDSTVKFFTTSWEPIKEGLFIVPDLDDWTLPSAKDKRADLENAVPFMLAKMSFVPQAKELTLTNNIGSYLPEEFTDLVGNSLRGKLVYRWNGKKMVKVTR